MSLPSLASALPLIDILTREGFHAMWARRGSIIVVITDAPSAVILSALACVVSL
jgi:hypothetical protein